MSNPLLSAIAGSDKVSVRLAKTPAEIEAAQRLRYQIFYDEFGAKPDDTVAATKLDADKYDPVADHIIVVDTSGDAEKIVGTYRLIRKEPADSVGGFYTSNEYDISALQSCGMSILELGRSCVLPDYRTRPVLQLLWQGIANYVMVDHQIELLFGCASFHGTDPDKISEQLSYLYHYHLAPPGLRPTALPDRFVKMDLHPKESLNPKKIFNELPPLIKGYLRVGSMVGDGAVIDEQFNTIDVCIVLQTHLVTNRYKKHYERKTGQNMPIPEELAGQTDADAEALFRRD